ncbi:MAG TPA: hypothetical protein VM846_20495 [Vicinamibacterales bacterium]|nr:hypothetical protein [Vicinamibacterales bacterium]
MTRKLPPRSPLAAAPTQRVPRGTPPKHGRVPSRPPAEPLKNAPQGQPTRAPRQRPVAKVPRPRRPQLVRGSGTGALTDLFDVFPDLPRPRRPRTRSRRVK